MCDPIMLGAAITLAALCASTMTAQVLTHSRGKPCRTATHTVEQYHGNWWSTWHTPRQDRWMTRLGVATFSLAAAAVIVAQVGCT